MTSDETTTTTTTEQRIITKEDFEFGRELGKGAYSTVILTTFKKTGVKYATKAIEKQLIIKENKVKTVKIEKQVLHMMDHPNIIKLFCTFQDKDYLCMYFMSLSPVSLCVETHQKGCVLVSVMK